LASISGIFLWIAIHSADAIEVLAGISPTIQRWRPIEIKKVLHEGCREFKPPKPDDKTVLFSGEDLL